MGSVVVGRSTGKPLKKFPHDCGGGHTHKIGRTLTADKFLCHVLLLLVVVYVHMCCVGEARRVSP